MEPSAQAKIVEDVLFRLLEQFGQHRRIFGPEIEDSDFPIFLPLAHELIEEVESLAELAIDYRVRGELFVSFAASAKEKLTLAEFGTFCTRFLEALSAAALLAIRIRYVEAFGRVSLELAETTPVSYLSPEELADFGRAGLTASVQSLISEGRLKVLATRSEAETLPMLPPECLITPKGFGWAELCCNPNKTFHEHHAAPFLADSDGGFVQVDPVDCNCVEHITYLNETEDGFEPGGRAFCVVRIGQKLAAICYTAGLNTGTSRRFHWLGSLEADLWWLIHTRTTPANLQSLLNPTKIAPNPSATMDGSGDVASGETLSTDGTSKVPKVSTENPSDSVAAELLTTPATLAPGMPVVPQDVAATPEESFAKLAQTLSNREGRLARYLATCRADVVRLTDLGDAIDPLGDEAVFRSQSGFPVGIESVAKGVRKMNKLTEFTGIKWEASVGDNLARKICIP